MQAHINGNEVFYTTHGQGRPMLLMHGGSGLDHTYFRPWLDTLSDQLQLIYYDQLGQGRSTRPQSYEGISMDTWADEADALRASLGHERIILLGHSFGGFIAQEYALRHGDHLDGLILCDTAPVLDYQDVVMTNAQARGTAEQVQAVIAGLSAPVADDAAFRQLWVTILPLYFNTYDPKVAAALDNATHYSAGGFNQGMGVCLPAFNVLSRLHEITVPTLVMAGRHDWITPPAQAAERLHAGLPNSQLAIFEQSGHFPFIEEQDLFVKTVRDWISSLS
ncbi:MAG TPA: alpha/beta fold hydrolase [Ktedonobacteraceae bacterium]